MSRAIETKSFERKVRVECTRGCGDLPELNYFKKFSIDLPGTSREMEIYGNTELEHFFGLGKDFEKNKLHEPPVTEYLVDYFDSNPDSIFFDIGGGIGYYSVLAKACSENLTDVYCFESDGEKIDCIEKNKKEFTSGFFEIYNFIVDDGSRGEKLDEYFDNIYPDIVKIDVQGQENEVIKGMEETIEESNPILVVEIHFPGNYRKRIETIRKVLPDVYRFKLCMDHRNPSSRFKEVDNLPKKSFFQELKERVPEGIPLPISFLRFLGVNIFGDYMVICEPSETDSRTERTKVGA